MKDILILTTVFVALPSVSAAQTNLEAPYDEIVVKAQKRDQSIQEVPAAITALAQDDLDALGVQQFDDLADFIPGLEVQEQSANNPGFVIRGLTSDSGQAFIEPRVSIFQDGVSTSRSRGSFVEVFDTEVEVLRGPQPTLFGRSALIGAISLNSVRPEIGGGANGSVRAGYGSYDFAFAEMATNIPLGDKLAGRIAARIKSREGYVTNLTGGEDFQGFQTAAFRGSLLWEPTDRVETLLVANWQEDDNPGTAFKSGTFRPAGGDTSPFTGAVLNSFGGPISDGTAALGLRRTLWNLTGRIDVELADALTLTSITGYREFDSNEVFDPDGFQYDLILAAEDAEGEQFSQELRLAYDNGGRLAGFLGVNYVDESGEQRTPLRYNENVVAALQVTNPATGLPLLFTAPPGTEQDPLPLSAVNAAIGVPDAVADFTEVAANFADVQTFEAFADATLSLTERLDLTAGLRYTRDEKETGQLYFIPGSSDTRGAFITRNPLFPAGTGIFFGGAVLTDDAAGFRSGNDAVYASDAFDGWTGRLAANLEVTDGLNLFANYARGRRPEVINYGGDPASIVGIPEGGFETIDAETVDSYEIGAKGQFLSNALQADGSFYYYDYTNFQTTVVNGVGDVDTVNAGGATAYGFEGTLLARASDMVSFFGNYAWNDATFDDESDDGTEQVFGGNRFRLSPEHAFTVGANLTADTRHGTFALRPIYTYRTEVFFDNDNDRGDLQGQDFIVDEVQDAYGVLDIRATWTSADGQYKVEVFGENVLDEEYLLDAGNTGDLLGIPTFIPAAPATYGVYLSSRF